MRILMISANPLDARLGAAKVLIELADAMHRLGGITCELVGPEQLGVRRTLDAAGWTRFSRAQRDFIQARAGGLDVVDYDHEHLPHARSEFDSRPLFVARSVLLAHHLETIRIPTPVTPRSFLGTLVHRESRTAFQRLRIDRATQTVEQADLINVSNDDDKTELIRRGVDPAKIVVMPFGMHAARRALFSALPTGPPPRPVVAFVGTFDYRKGAHDFARIFGRIRDAVPDAQLALFGTAGLLRTADQVLSFFPRKLRSQIHVHPRFAPDELPALLADCSVGIFPSYYEGFGFGVLEMLAAAVPVVAYDAPGPPMMLGRRWLVPPGDVTAMADKVIALLRDRHRLAAARAAARQLSAPFDWAPIAQQTANIYAERLRARRVHASGLAVV